MKKLIAISVLIFTVAACESANEPAIHTEPAIDIYRFEDELGFIQKCKNAFKFPCGMTLSECRSGRIYECVTRVSYGP